MHSALTCALQRQCVILQLYLNVPMLGTTPGLSGRTHFCLEHSVNPLLEDVADPIHYFEVFAVHYHDGCLMKDGEPIRAHTVEDALRAIGQPDDGRYGVQRPLLNWTSCHGLLLVSTLQRLEEN